MTHQRLLANMSGPRVGGPGAGRIGDGPGGRGGRVLLVVAAPNEATPIAAGIRDGAAAGGGVAPDGGTAALGDGPGDGVAPTVERVGDWRRVALSSRFDLVVSGIGKANAAAATALALDPARHDAVISVGIGGLLPALEPGAARCTPPAAPAMGTAWLAARSIFADEGFATPAGFVAAAEMGWPLGPFEVRPAAPSGGLGPGDPRAGADARATGGVGIVPDGALAAALAASVAGRALVATVSTCSGTDALAGEIAARAGRVAASDPSAVAPGWPLIEAMEGAAVGAVAARLGVRFAEVRVLSNTTGDRPKQTWAIGAALAALRTLAAKW